MSESRKDIAVAGARPSSHPAPVRRMARVQRVSITAIRIYSRWVTFLKFVLPATALALLALVVAWPRLTDTPKARVKADEGQAEIVNPRYLSVDEKNQPYSLTAARAAQSPDQPGLLALTRPEAEMTDTSGAWVNIDSELGWYDRTNGVLQMRGSVHVLRDDGSEFTTDEAFSEVRKGTAWGDRHVIGQGPQGEIVAEGFRIADRGRSVVFLNQGKADIQTRGTSSAAPSQSTTAPVESKALPSAEPRAVPPQVAAMPPAEPVPEAVPMLVPPDGKVLPRATPPPPASNAPAAKGDRT